MPVHTLLAARQEVFDQQVRLEDRLLKFLKIAINHCLVILRGMG